MSKDDDKIKSMLERWSHSAGTNYDLGDFIGAKTPDGIRYTNAVLHFMPVDQKHIDQNKALDAAVAQISKDIYEGRKPSISLAEFDKILQKSDLKGGVSRTVLGGLEGDLLPHAYKEKILDRGEEQIKAKDKMVLQNPVDPKVPAHDGVSPESRVSPKVAPAMPKSVIDALDRLADLGKHEKLQEGLGKISGGDKPKDPIELALSKVKAESVTVYRA